ncbi:hypothetical protein NQ854_19030 [Rhodococcus ruber]|uniref:hypothetical protein n=1 Tax=Rhodococcus TaxID=1827 RepID=UPI00111E132C|nr:MULTISPECIES: hypothetical protein [Rhodococcus]MCZ1074490.1 hypothetical protein [Rhodococcus sp. A5(2022)]MDO1481911.1 hypothetical protein [Rhodococcus ruber]QDC15958.1 hypothetical protein E2561_19090 [Rhodococcus ruber]
MTSSDAFSRSLATLALFASAASAYYAWSSNNVAKEALGNSSPSVAITTSIGSMDNEGKNYTPIQGSDISLNTIRSGNFWLQITVKNGGGRAILIDGLGVQLANGAVFDGSQIRFDRSKCPEKTGDLRCPNSLPLSLPEASNATVWFPLSSSADIIAGGNGNQDALLKVNYTSPDVADQGKTVETDYTITAK